MFELDRYFVPKELVLNLAALIVAAALVFKRRTLRFDLVDGLIALFLLWSVASAIFATNHWVAQRSVAITISGAIIFWGGRAVAPTSIGSPSCIPAAGAARWPALTLGRRCHCSRIRRKRGALQGLRLALRAPLLNPHLLRLALNFDGRRAARHRAVAELAKRVIPPAVRDAAGRETTGVFVARANRREH